MGLLIKKNIAGLLEKSGLLKSRLCVAGCALLVLCNILGFTLLAEGASAFFLIISNALTVTFTVLAFSPAGTLLQNALTKKQAELDSKQALEKRIEALERENNELVGKLDTRHQTAGMPGNITFTFKLEKMEYAKKGYMVKENDLEALMADEKYQDMIPAKGGWTKMLEFLNLKEKGQRKILYIKKAYYKASIGIDFGKIKYAIDGDYIYFAGARFSKLHDISSELEHDPQDIERMIILNETENGVKVENDPEYGEFIKAYSTVQESQTQEAIEADVEAICTQYTSVLQSNLAKKFKFIRFVRDEEVLGSTLTWYALSEGAADRQVSVVASNMLMLADVIQQTTEAEEQEIIIK